MHQILVLFAVGLVSNCCCCLQSISLSLQFDRRPDTRTSSRQIPLRSMTEEKNKLLSSSLLPNSKKGVVQRVPIEYITYPLLVCFSLCLLPGRKRDRERDCKKSASFRQSASEANTINKVATKVLHKEFGMVFSLSLTLFLGDVFGTQ